MLHAKFQDNQTSGITLLLQAGFEGEGLNYKGLIS